MVKRIGRGASAAVKETIGNQSLVGLAEQNIVDYGTYVIEDRAIPEFHDGLKPVHRRILWGMHKLGLESSGGFKKSARVVGEVIGKYHPHGSAPVYEAMVGMANLTTPLVWGQGNWGWFDDSPAAAERYTECKLTAYAEACLLDPDYLAVTPMAPNYDGNEREPVFLPAIWPNSLINGSLTGVAVGAGGTSLHPAFSPQSVIKLVQRALEKPIGPKLCARTLEFASKYGGVADPDMDARIALFRDGHGRINFGCRLEADQTARTVTITGVPHNFRVVNAIEKLADLPEVADVNNASSRKSGGVNIRIVLKRTVLGNAFHDAVEKIAKITSVPQSFKLNITDRSGIDKVQFASGWSMPKLVAAWLEWRLDLERRMQQHKIDNFNVDLHRLGLLRLAVDHLEIVFQVLRAKTDNMNALLAKKLQIPEADAEYILNQAVRRLGNLSATKIDADIRELKAKVKLAKGRRDDPHSKVAADLTDAAHFFNKQRKAAV